jgi:hypothetical protein
LYILLILVARIQEKKRLLNNTSKYTVIAAPHAATFFALADAGLLAGLPPDLLAGLDLGLGIVALAFLVDPFFPVAAVAFLLGCFFAAVLAFAAGVVPVTA